MTFSALTPSSRIEVINQLATGSLSVNVTEHGAGGWQVLMHGFSQRLGRPSAIELSDLVVPDHRSGSRSFRSKAIGARGWQTARDRHLCHTPREPEAEYSGIFMG